MELASMLPGFRFLFSAIILSMSVLIFGLGAAALLRSAHEEFANLPSRRATPEPMFARLSDEQPPTLALLRVDPVADQLAAPAPALDTTAARAPETAPAEPEKLAALISAERTPVETAKPEEPAKEAGAETAAAPASAPTAAEAPGDAELKTGTVSVPESDADAQTATLPLPAAETPSFEPSIATTLIATLGGPAVQIEQKTAATEAKPDRQTIKNRTAERARERRRMAAIRRARLAREAALTLQQQQPNPFAFPLTPATR